MKELRQKAAVEFLSEENLSKGEMLSLIPFLHEKCEKIKRDYETDDEEQLLGKSESFHLYKEVMNLLKNKIHLEDYKNELKSLFLDRRGELPMT